MFSMVCKQLPGLSENGFSTYQLLVAVQFMANVG
jgi:hypothetical protein